MRFVRPRKNNRLTVEIHAPVSTVFAYLINPNTSPLWVEGFVKEETSEWPAKEGTVYRNLNKKGEWNQYTVTAIEKNKLFILKHMDGNYHVRYTLTPVSSTATQVEYYEWVNKGRLEQFFPQSSLETLKQIVETSKLFPG